MEFWHIEIMLACPVKKVGFLKLLIKECINSGNIVGDFAE